MHPRRHDISSIRSSSRTISLTQNEISPLLLNISNHPPRSHATRVTLSSGVLTFVRIEIVLLSDVSTRLDLMRICVNADMFASPVTNAITKRLNVQISLSPPINSLDAVSSYRHHLQFSYQSFYQSSYQSSYQPSYQSSYQLSSSSSLASCLFSLSSTILLRSQHRVATSSTFLLLSFRSLMTQSSALTSSTFYLLLSLTNFLHQHLIASFSTIFFFFTPFFVFSFFNVDVFDFSFLTVFARTLTSASVLHVFN